MNIGVCEKSKMLVVAAGVVILLAMTGCEKKDVYDPDKPDYDNVFDFSTRASYTLNVKYEVPQDYQVYFEVYTQDPEQLDADGQVVKRDIEPIDVGFTDGNGNYNQKIVVPATAKFLYIYSPYAGVPRVLVAEITNGVLSEATYPDEVSGARSLIARAGDEAYKDEPYNKTGGLKRLGFWKNTQGIYQLNGKLFTVYGRPDYVNPQKGIVVSNDILRIINAAVPEGKKGNPELIQNGDIHITQKAHIDLCLVDEKTSASSTLAYYCYETANPPKKVADIKDIIIAFPNSKILQYHGWYPIGNNGALERGEGIRLHYWKDGEDMGTEFPENTSIGWVIYNNGYKNAISGNGGIAPKQPHFYSAKALNSDNKEHVALFKSGDNVLFGFEDWTGDYDYNDVVFYVKSNPMDAITPGVPEVPEKPDNDDEVNASVTYRGILTFEDNWPARADFDMNDVVVKYVSTVGYNKKNEVVETKDIYTILWAGATFDNSFAYQLDAMRNEVEVEISSTLGGNGGAYVDPSMDKATIRLANKVLAYANNKDEKAEFTVVTKYTGRRIDKADFTLPPYNPFITTTSEDKEVHLTNMRPTEKLNKEYLGFGDDRSDPDANLYYITYDENGQQMPFAINLVFEKDEDMENFIIPFCDSRRESRRIDTFYPSFLNWVKTNGKEDADWYLHPAKE